MCVALRMPVYKHRLTATKKLGQVESTIPDFWLNFFLIFLFFINASAGRMQRVRGDMRVVDIGLRRRLSYIAKPNRR